MVTRPADRRRPAPQRRRRRAHEAAEPSARGRPRSTPARDTDLAHPKRVADRQLGDANVAVSGGRGPVPIGTRPNCCRPRGWRADRGQAPDRDRRPLGEKGVRPVDQGEADGCQPMPLPRVRPEPLLRGHVTRPRDAGQQAVVLQAEQASGVDSGGLCPMGHEDAVVPRKQFVDIGRNGCQASVHQASVTVAGAIGQLGRGGLWITCRRGSTWRAGDRSQRRSPEITALRKRCGTRRDAGSCQDG